VLNPNPDIENTIITRPYYGKTIMKNIIYRTVTVSLLLVSINLFANDLLTNQLKTFHKKLNPEVEKLLVFYAENNQFLNALEMQQAAFIASKVDEWEIAGFYCIARPMISGLSLKSAKFDKKMNSKSMKGLHKYWKQLDARLKPLRKIKKFKELKKLRTVELLPCNKLVKLKLNNNIDILKSSLKLYVQWQPKINKDFHHIPSYTITKSENEINALFNQLNEIYLKANLDFIKLLGIPRYKQLKLKSYEDLEEFTKTVDSGEFDLNDYKDLIGKKLTPKDLAKLKKMMAPINRKREMEQIEIDNLLFPEIAWGSWY
jgi:hypothetical protein